MDISEIIKKVNAKFPGINAVASEEFDGQKGGIWFKSSSYTTEFEDMTLPVQLIEDDYMVESRLEKFMNEQGMFCEPYDRGTLFAWPN